MDAKKYSVTEQELSFESEGNKIYGRVMIPEGEGIYPVVVFSHGFGGNHEQENILQEEIAKQGIVVYAFDFAGGSGYEPGQSEGKMTDMSVLTEAKNVEDAVAMIKKQEYADQNKIYLMGASMGGAVSSVAASRNREEVKGLILLYPAFVLFENAHKRFEKYDDITDTDNLMGLTIGRKYYTDIWDMDIYQEITNYSGKVWIFHGTKDRLVPISYSEQAMEAFPNAELTPIEGEGHGYSSGAQKEIADLLSGFFE